MNLPQAFLDRMKERLGENFPAFLASYENPPYKGLRVNTLKISAEEFFRRAPFPLGEQVGGDPACVYVGEEKPGADVYHFAGLYYVQEPSAMTAGILAKGLNKRRVLDLCAAPGGKTTHIAQEMAGEGILIANEVEPARAKILSQNVERMGIANCAVTSASPEALASRFPCYFDLVLADAPCSGEGMFKKEPNAIPEWSAENVARCAVRQRGILDEAAKTVADGGHLLYSTCTFAEEEDEWQVEDFLRCHPDFSLIEMRKLYPHTFRGEGHFCALLRKQACPPPTLGAERRTMLNSPVDCERAATGAQESATGVATVPAVATGVGEGERPYSSIKPFPAQKNAAAERAFRAFEADFFREPLSGTLHTLADGRMYLVPDGMPDLGGVRLLRLGVEIGAWDGKIFKPAHALAMALGEKAARKLSLSREEAKVFLRGETLQRDFPSGWCAVCVEEFPLGLGKCVGGTVKNHLPKGLRLIKEQ